MNDSNLLWLLQWYDSHCNGDWEHQKNIHIETLDNPGWSVSINLVGTELEDKFFQEIEFEHSSKNWLICFVKDKSFEGRCGTLNLSEMLKIFRSWAEENKN